MTASAPPRPPPGPTGLAFLAGVPQLLADPLGYLRRVAERYPGTVSLSPYLRRIYLVVDPAHVKQVLHDRAERYRKHELTLERLGAFLGKSVVVTEGALWRRQRREMQPSFHRQRLENLCPLMVESTAADLERWELVRLRGGLLPIVAEMKRLTLGIASRALFGVDLGPEADRIAPAVQTAQEHVAQRMRSFTGLFDRLLAIQDGNFRRAGRVIDEVVEGVLRARRQAPEGDDLLSTLLRSRDPETGQPLDHRELADQVKGLMVAGFESTATVLAWTWYLLARHPAVRERLEAEVDDVLGDGAPTMEQLPQLRYTRMVFEETMRLYPPVWMTLRTPVEDDEIDGQLLPRGSLLLLSPYVTQRHPRWWPDPDRFDPERFAPAAASARPRFASFPFGGGPRVCLGAAFATMEAQIILAMVVQRYRLELAPPSPVAVRALSTLQPERSFTVALQRRSRLGATLARPVGGGVAPAPDPTRAPWP